MEKGYNSIMFRRANEKYDLISRYRELLKIKDRDKRTEWEWLRISKEAWDYINSNKNPAGSTSKTKSTTTCEDWYCMIQKLMIIHLNDM